MITSEEIKEIGAFIKPHGVKGEIAAQLDYDIDLGQLRCIVIDVDGIFVPFFLNGVRTKSAHTVLLSIDGVNTDAEAKYFAGRTIFALRSDLDTLLSEDEYEQDGFYLSDLIGFDLYNEHGTRLGTVTDFDDSTANLLLKIKPADNSGDVFLVPAASDLIEDIDSGKKTITMAIPEGIINI